MIKKRSICSVVSVAFCILIAGCGDSSDSSDSTAATGNPAYDTAIATTTASINAGDATEEMKELTLQQPEIRTMNLCIAKQLELQGWTREQHDFLMQETNNTANIAMINKRKFSDAQMLKHFGPLYTAQGSCI